MRADTEGKGSKKKFKGECFYCKKKGHRQADCRSKLSDEKDGKEGKEGKKPSTGPLPTPSGGKGLSPAPEQAKVVSEVVSEVSEMCWAAKVNIERQGLVWVIDSGCSRHMIYSREAFVDYTTLDIPRSVQTASGTEILGVGIGSIILHTNQEGRIRRILMIGSTSD